jgi:uncharacterized membrane protein YfcA
VSWQPLRVSAADLVIAGLAAVLAGAVNALAGGGTLISFPALIALGVPPIAANVTNAVALCPGYFGAAVAQRAGLQGQRRRIWLCIPAALLGGLGGAAILLHTGERTFEALVPFMLLFASLLLAVQERVRAAVLRRLADPAHTHPSAALAVVPIFCAGLYGGFFSAGMSVIVLAVLGAVLDDSLTRLNALKQIVVLGINVAAAAFFLFSGQIVWSVCAVMAAGALLGGVLGGRAARKLKPGVLRWTVILVGVTLAVLYWMR